LVYFPKEKHTKGDVMRYYAQVAPYLLPTVKDRPLVLKRTPEGIDGEVFFQQKPPGHAPDAVRVLPVRTEDGKQERVIGGDAATLLYLVQIGCISVDPWMSRVRTIDFADYFILDLDPGPRANFATIVEVAKATKAELDEMGLSGALKTSGSRGLHIVVPLPARTSYETARLLAQVIATRVAERHPKIATVERTVSERPPRAVYVDYLQNVQGKSVAGVYSVRAKPGATVSTPLRWRELEEGLDPREFTIETVPPRIGKLGCVWAEAMARKNPAGVIKRIVAAK
jgi:bifunctional non-homologous end joining protein LigD